MVDGFEIYDEMGLAISYLLFGPLYAGDSSDMIIQIGSDSDMDNVILTPEDVEPSLILSSMRDASLNSYQYIKLSLDGLSYTSTLTIPSILADVNQEVHVQCTVPNNIDGGNFVCNIKVQAETT